jgi:16S rRNA (guanine527-N7)-methyltransferase
MRELAATIEARATACRLSLPDGAAEALALHARMVLDENDRLHLTSISEPEEFVERHLGESFEGAAMLAADVTGELLDLGSGNGYPALPLSAARPGLRLLMTEAVAGKAEFLSAVLDECGFGGGVLAKQVQRIADLDPERGPFRLITTRALGGWERLLPRFASALREDGELLLWAGGGVDRITRRSAWRKLRLLERRALPGRERSWIWRFSRS